MNNGRITSLLPRVYHNEDENLIAFVKLLEPDIDRIESLTTGLTDIIDIDKTPVKYLPYIASKINAPLMGTNPALWRKQIRVWPAILKIKGTEQSVHLFFSSLGFSRHDIETYWRDAEGNYVTEPPAGEPFKGTDGVWYNSRTHYFSVRLFWTNDCDLGAEINNSVLDFIKKWIPRVKPIYAELLEYIVGFHLSEFIDTEELLHTYIKILSGDIYPWTQHSESVSAWVINRFDESPWPRHRYSEEGLDYDGRTVYDSTNEVAESIKIVVEKAINNAKYVNDVADSADSLLNTLKIII